MRLLAVVSKLTGVSTNVESSEVTLSSPSIVKLSVSREEVSQLTRVNQDLVVTLRSGETITIKNFYLGKGESTIISQLSDMPLLPVPSEALTVNWCVPSARGEDGVNDQLPLASIATWPISTPLSKICNVAFAGPVPWRVGVLSLVDSC